MNASTKLGVVDGNLYCKITYIYRREFRDDRVLSCKIK